MNVQLEMFLHQIEKDKRENVLLGQRMLDAGLDPNMVDCTPTIFSDFAVNFIRTSKKRPMPVDDSSSLSHSDSNRDFLFVSNIFLSYFLKYYLKGLIDKYFFKDFMLMVESKSAHCLCKEALV